MNENETTTAPADLLAAMSHEWARQRNRLSASEYIDHAMAQEMVEDTPEERQRVGVERQRLEDLLQKGAEYHQTGYSFHRSERQTRGFSFKVPANALVWEIEPAGYVAGTEQSRLIWVALQD